jgi:hypothetical protein
MATACTPVVCPFEDLVDLFVFESSTQSVGGSFFFCEELELTPILEKIDDDSKLSEVVNARRFTGGGSEWLRTHGALDGALLSLWRSVSLLDLCGCFAGA